MLNNKAPLKSKVRFKSDVHEIYTEEVNKIVLNSNDDRRLQTFDRVTAYPYGTNAFKVCESEITMVRDLVVKNMQITSFYDQILQQQDRRLRKNTSCNA